MLLSDAASAKDFWRAPAALGFADQLALRPPLEPVRYEAVVRWEAYANGDYHTSTVAKQVALSGQLLADGGCALDFRITAPTLTQPEDPEPLETLALRLATLYEWVAVQVAPTGRLVALRNHEALLQAWAALAGQLHASTTAEDRITPTLTAFVDQQLQDPARVLQSLRHDYLYAALVPDFYVQPLVGPAPLAQTRDFSQFFDKLPLCFSELVEVLPAATGDTLAVVCRGKVDPQQTDVAAIGRLMAQAVGESADAPVMPHFHYEATHVLDRHTGLPHRVDLTVYGRLADRYNKQYTLTLNRV